MKNLLAQAEAQLTAVEARGAEAQDRLSAVRAITEDKGFWRHQSAGLGVLVGDDEPCVLRLPVATAELLTVCDHFHVKPLFAASLRDDRFYLLALSKNAVHLLCASRFDVETVDLPDAPKSFDEFLDVYDFERHVEFHTGSAAHEPAGRRPAVYHGQGGGADGRDEKKRLSEYCRRIDEQVVKAVRNAPAPVLLAAAEPLQGIYRQVSSSPDLDERTVRGNPDEAADEELHRQAVALLAEDFTRPIRAAAERVHRAQAAGLATVDLEAILRAVPVRAVDTLLVDVTRSCWGRFDASEGRLVRHAAQQPGDDELLNLAAVVASRGGAAVHAVESEYLPDDAPAAAVLRFHPDV